MLLLTSIELWKFLFHLFMRSAAVWLVSVGIVAGSSEGKYHILISTVTYWWLVLIAGIQNFASRLLQP
jgi:hypothetical protein